MKGLLFMFMLLFCCCALADSFKFNCCLWNIHSDFLTLLLSCPGGAVAREGGGQAVRRMKCTEKCGGKLLQLVIKCKSPDKECCTLPELWAAQGKGPTRSSARSCQTVSQVNWGKQADLQSWFWFQLQRHTEMFFAARIVGIKNVYFMFPSRGTSLPCVACSGSVSVSSACSGSLPPKCCVHCRQTHTHTHIHSQVRLILFIYSALPGESTLQSVYLAARLHKHCLAVALFTHETRRLSITWHLKP